MGLSAESVPDLSPGELRQDLSSGHIFVALMGSGHFTSSGHLFSCAGSRWMGKSWWLIQQPERAWPRGIPEVILAVHIPKPRFRCAALALLHPKMTSSSLCRQDAGRGLFFHQTAA